VGASNWASIAYFLILMGHRDAKVFIIILIMKIYNVHDEYEKHDV
jgi:hypothetical protein